MSTLRSWIQRVSAEVRGASLRDEVVAALTVTSVSVPQGVAYALIAGLPPAMGLYAGMLPAIVGALLRSSRHVVTGPTNAVSLLVGTSVAAQFDDPAMAAATLAFMVGGLQLLAGVLRLGSAVDYVSAAVVTGYISGAGLLIAAGQLPNLTGTTGARGTLPVQLAAWWQGLPALHLPTLGLGLGTAAAILLLRRWLPRGPSMMGVVGAGLLLAWALDLDSQGVMLVGGLSAIPEGLPPLVLPDAGLFWRLLPVAFAGVLLSLVESTSVARSIAGRSGQRLSLTQELLGTGAANLVAGLSGALPVSGSLSRSALNEQTGAKTRFASALSGVLMGVVLVGLSPLVAMLPVASLAGLLLVVARDLVDVPRIRLLLRATVADRLAFVGTLVGTWLLPLDQAIALGVGINIVLFLRQSQLLVVRELRVSPQMRLQEVDPDDDDVDPTLQQCRHIRILHLEGPLFFGAAGELATALDRVIRDREVTVLVVRLKRTQGLDFTVAAVFASAHRRLAAQGRSLLLVGMRADTMDDLRNSGLGDVMGSDALFPTQPGWFVAMNEALAVALRRAGEHDCAVSAYVAHHESDRLDVVATR
ncbi:MAG: SulP family inorganic anion transporter [Myxococcales bacterium]|nr:SulP family inorganic anion transporter [Myxococcales bacterium]